MAITQLAALGDSTTQGTVASVSTYQGGLGCWVELLSERLAMRPDLGPLLSPGFRQIHLGIAADSEWTSTGTWTSTVSSDLFDRAPFGRAFYSIDPSAVYTWTYVKYWRPIVGFDLFWIDYTKSGSVGGDWQYSLDGGSTWINMGQTILHDQKLKKFYVNSPIISTLKIRPYDGSSAVGALIVGITPYFVDPRTATKGLIVHNLGSGAQQLGSNLVNSGSSGDRLAWLDDVTVGTGSPISHQPSFMTCMFINDVTDANSSQWGTDLTTLNTRVSSYCTLLFMSPWQCGTFYNNTQQINYRAQTKSTAKTLGKKYFDFYDAWSALGIPDYDTALAEGYLYDGTGHESQQGHTDIQERLFRFIQKNYFPALTVLEDFTNSTSQVGEYQVQGGRSTAIKKMTGLTRTSSKAVGALDSRYVKTWLGVA